MVVQQQEAKIPCKPGYTYKVAATAPSESIVIATGKNNPTLVKCSGAMPVGWR